MNCARCENRLTKSRFDGEACQRCDECGCILINRDKLARLCAKRKMTDQELMDSWHRTEPIDVDKSVRCPECLSMMDRFSIPNSQHIPQDYCRKCQWIWCDPGELELHLLAYSASKKGLEAARFREIHENMTDHEKHLLKSRIDALPKDHFDLIGFLADLHRHQAYLRP